jgi:hypothetical protein
MRPAAQWVVVLPLVAGLARPITAAIGTAALVTFASLFPGHLAAIGRGLLIAAGTILGIRHPEWIEA